jgi:NAD(P)H-hydrate epimerase
MTTVRVTTAAEAAARDQAAINAGTPSFDLMLQAGTTAAAVVLRDYADRLAQGVALYAGSGNNGGDAYIVAAQLARAGVTVRVQATAPPRTPDATRAMALARSAMAYGPPTGHERVVVDGLLGTGHRGGLRDAVAAACTQMQVARDGGAVIVALDVPSGLDATTGDIAVGSVAAHTTLCFGTIKRGVLLARAHAGRTLVLDIGLQQHADYRDGAWLLPGAHDYARWLPPMAWDAHKGIRGRVAVVGGTAGMAGAAVLAARAALAAGAGLVHAVVDAPSVAAVQGLVPQAMAESWEHAATTLQRCRAIAIGPGLGRDARAAQLLERVVTEHRNQPLVLDADALWLVADSATAHGTEAAAVLHRWSRDGRTLVCTPHLGEFARLLGHEVPALWHERAAAVRDFAERAGVTLLLKGTPTLVATAGGGPITVVPYGTPLLATGGSGDLLTGLIVALLGQGLAPVAAAVCGATAHGRAAELATARVGGVRGGTLELVVQALPNAWCDMVRVVRMPPGVLAQLPSPLSAEACQ